MDVDIHNLGALLSIQEMAVKNPHLSGIQGWVANEIKKIDDAMRIELQKPTQLAPAPQKTLVAEDTTGDSNKLPPTSTTVERRI